MDYSKETQENSSFGDKLLQHCDVLNSIQRGRWKPITFQLSPTGKCDFNCSMCSVSNRDKTLELPFKQIVKALKDFRKLGARSIEISGGGNPLLYPKINEIIKLAHKLGYDIGVISNSINPGKYLTKESAEKLTWFRSSLSAFYFNQNAKYDFSIIPEGKLSFSHIITDQTTKSALKSIVELCESRPDVKFVRLAPNCLDKNAIKSFKKNWEPFIKKIDKDGKFFFKEVETAYLPYPDFCGVGMVRPYCTEDGNIYVCSSFLLRKRKYEPQYIIGHITDIRGMYKKCNKNQKEFGYPYDVPIKECYHCMLPNNNKLLHNIVREMNDKNFA
jgi:organic radical activating enzyme